MKKKEWKLSKSACAKYLQCPFSFKAYYLDKIRPVKVGSPLVFGNGLDAALNALLLNTGDPIKIYDKTVGEVPLGRMVPNKNDFDGDLLSPIARELLLGRLRTLGYKGDDIDGLYASLFQKYQAKEPLSKNQEKALDLICREVLMVKAILMIEAYKKHVLPNIETVHNVQKRTGSGVLDATVTWKGLGKRIIDNKTAGRPYSEDSIDYSLQLAMYALEENIRDVTYVVLLKNIKKHRRKVCVECGHVGKGTHKSCDAIVEGGRCGGEWESES